MLSVGLFPALSLIVGAVLALAFNLSPHWGLWLLLGASAGALPAWWWRARAATVGLLALGFVVAGALLTSSARERALHSSLGATLDAEFGHFGMETLGPEGPHPPILVRAVLLEDATSRETYVSLRMRVIAVRLHDRWLSVDGGVIASVGGDTALRSGGMADGGRADQWRAGRTIEAPMTFRRAARFLDDGVPDFERDLALDGVTLLTSVKSGLLIEVIERGSPLSEAAAVVRGHVRRAIARWVAPHDPVSAAIATAVLIGDRGGLPDETRDLLQAAGTYHVIAISGGNIAILATVLTGCLALCGIRGRRAAVPAIVLLTLYALVATSGPSVWRATLMALLYFGARAIDHRVPVWHAAAVAAALMVVVQPLDVRDPGFVLTFGATAALIDGARRGAATLAALTARHRALSWVVASVFSSLAVEAALLPVSAQMFSRVTSAGLLLNLLAVPMTAAIQIAALVTVVFDRVAWIAGPAGWIAHLATAALVGSAHLTTLLPWLSARVPAPGAFVIVSYYALLVLALIAPRGRIIVVPALLIVTIVIGRGINVSTIMHRSSDSTLLHLTMFDVGQGEAMLLETPSGERVIIDAGGAPFGGGVDIGQRVLAPALWSRGVGSLSRFLVTHGDPDHIGGAPAIVEDFRPARVWEGIRVPAHPPSLAFADQVARLGIEMTALRSRQDVSIGAVRIRVLHPPSPDWERVRVRNDDSVVLEVIYGDVALLLTGDIGADVERELIPSLTPARVRILKVAHHGSRTSTSQQLLDAWRPTLALISCGRGNRFGHPAPDVVQRLEAIGAMVFRTDRDGQITVETDRKVVKWRTYVGHEEYKDQSLKEHEEQKE